ncbi:MAG TPA: hypothetical protein PK400_10675 [Phycisphaerales bacterium]|nr:hypothetical protein [Phycisphaerales bacterium]HRQ76630.1 hypothetical protein [Phycisphaerales bacterium]
MSVHTRFSLKLFCVLVAYSMWFVAPAHAQHGHAHDHDHDIEFPEPTNFVEAASLALEIPRHLVGDLAEQAFDHIHDDSLILAKVARMLGRFALDASSGVQREHVREINIAGRELARIADALHDATDTKDAAACARLLDAMKEHLAVIERNLHRVLDRPFTVKITSAGTPNASQPITLTLEIQNDRNERVTAEQLDVAHEHLLHVIVVAEDLSWYRHVHPTPAADGTFTLTMTFPAGGSYRLFHDFKPKGMPHRMAFADFVIAGDRPARTKLAVDAHQPKVVDGLTVSLHAASPIRAGTDTVLHFTISKDGAAVTDFEPHMGERAHLVVISEDRSQFVHAHAHDEHHHHAHDHDDHADHDHDHHEGVAFHVTLAKPGLHRAWVEFKHGGKVFTIPFVIEAVAGDAAAPQREHGHGHNH